MEPIEKQWRQGRSKCDESYLFCIFQPILQVVVLSLAVPSISILSDPSPKMFAKRFGYRVSEENDG